MTIRRDYMGVTRPALKPGHLPEPVKPVSTLDPPEYVAACLECPLPECWMDSASCPLKSLPHPGRGRRKRGGP